MIGIRQCPVCDALYYGNEQTCACPAEAALVDISPRCATCRYWEQRPKDDWGACRRIPGADSVWLMAEYGHETWLYTLGDFGCVLHEPKP